MQKTRSQFTDRLRVTLFIQYLDPFQIMPQRGGGMCNQLLINGREQRNLQPAVFEIPPADNGSVYKDGRMDDSSEVEDYAVLSR